MGIFNFEGQLKENGSRVITAGGQRTDVTVNGEEGKGTLIATTLGENNTPALKLSLELPEGPRGPQGIPGPQGPKGDTGNNGKTPTFQWNEDQLQICIDGKVVSEKNLKGPVGSDGRIPLIKIGDVYTVGPDAGAVVQDINPDTYDVTLKFGIPQGKKGFSPKATVTQNYDNNDTIITGATITIIDEDGKTTAIIPKGDKGDKGDTGDLGNLSVLPNEISNPTSIITNVSYSGETIGTEYISINNIKSVLGISNIIDRVGNIETNIGNIETNIGNIETNIGNIEQLILVSNTQPQNSNTQIWFDTSNPIGG